MTRVPFVKALCGGVVFNLIAACSASDGPSGHGLTAQPPPAAAGSGGLAGAGGTSAAGGSGSMPTLNIGGVSSGGGPVSCGFPDCDADGFTVEQGDLGDMDPMVNPGAYDVPANGIDEDCNGVADDTVTACDQMITDIADADPNNAARGIGLCHFATETDRRWGVLSAAYVFADGKHGPDPIGHGLPNDFGPNVSPLEGQRLLVLSSGTARRPKDKDYRSPMGAQHGPLDPDLMIATGELTELPPGFPIESPACPGVMLLPDAPAYDAAGLELTIRVPTNARSFRFKFNFYTYEFPGYICSAFNDFFLALQDPAPPEALLGNISFDSQNNPVSVNNGYLEVCDPAIGATMPGGKTFACALGTDQLTDTGFDDIDGAGSHAATGWLETASPVEPGSIVKLRLVVHDMSDPVLDSTVLIDQFEFSTEPAMGPVTTPVEVPK